MRGTPTNGSSPTIGKENGTICSSEPFVGYGGYGISELFGGLAAAALYVPREKENEWFEQFADTLQPNVSEMRIMEIMHVLFPNYGKKKINFIEWLGQPHWGQQEVPRADGENAAQALTYNMLTDSDTFELNPETDIMASVALMPVEEVNTWVEAGVPMETIMYQLIRVSIEGVGDALYPSFTNGVTEEEMRGSDMITNRNLAITIRLASIVAQAAWLSDKTRLELLTHTTLPSGISAYTLNFYDSRVREMAENGKSMIMKKYLLREK